MEDQLKKEISNLISKTGTVLGDIRVRDFGDAQEHLIELGSDLRTSTLRWSEFSRQIESLEHDVHTCQEKMKDLLNNPFESEVIKTQKKEGIEKELKRIREKLERMEK